MLFAVTAVLVATGVGVLSHSLAARLTWERADDDFREAVEAVAGFTADHGGLTPEVLADPEEDAGLDEWLYDSRTIIVQVLGPDGDIADEGNPLVLPVAGTDRAMTDAEEPGRTASVETRVGGERVRVTSVSLGAGGEPCRSPSGWERWRRCSRASGGGSCWSAPGSRPWPGCAAGSSPDGSPAGSPTWPGSPVWCPSPVIWTCRCPRRAGTRWGSSVRPSTRC
ncbi:hypothetical protein [Streptomyces sp. I6]|uniref:hypothetical protein n=1 Tax=Streptomyces sp. I6 TaxID=2483113 RepID=UPI0028804212|nr:hypothetical protein [Streptomyces sp. I6]